MILDGSLGPGQKIPSQRELAVRLKLSRASLREALLTLEAIGLIVTQPGAERSWPKCRPAGAP